MCFSTRLFYHRRKNKICTRFSKIPIHQNDHLSHLFASYVYFTDLSLSNFAIVIHKRENLDSPSPKWSCKIIYNQPYTSRVRFSEMLTSILLSNKMVTCNHNHTTHYKYLCMKLEMTRVDGIMDYSITLCDPSLSLAFS